jgi:dynactin-6
VCIEDWSTIGAKCTVLPDAAFNPFDGSPYDVLPSHTVVYGPESARRAWSGESKLQALALHAKHLEALREVGPPSRWS